MPVARVSSCGLYHSHLRGDHSLRWLAPKGLVCLSLVKCRYMWQGGRAPQGSPSLRIRLPPRHHAGCRAPQVSPCMGEAGGGLVCVVWLPCGWQATIHPRERLPWQFSSPPHRHPTIRPVRRHRQVARVDVRRHHKSQPLPMGEAGGGLVCVVWLPCGWQATIHP
jgi:hypothetical protein